MGTGSPLSALPTRHARPGTVLAGAISISGIAIIGIRAEVDAA